MADFGKLYPTPPGTTWRKIFTPEPFQWDSIVWNSVKIFSGLTFLEDSMYSDVYQVISGYSYFCCFLLRCFLSN